ncbi:MAG: signal peptidase I [Anaerotignum sp.]|nr:signal peptidase I [Anaerotignum sp.]
MMETEELKQEVAEEAVELKETTEKKKKEKKSMSLIMQLVLLVVLVVVLRNVMGTVLVKGSSMEPNFNHGDLVFINKLSTSVGSPDYGDVVICKLDEGAGYENIIKRVIGLPGDEIEILESDDDEEVFELYVNGEYIEEPFLGEPMMTEGNIDYPFEVPENSYFVMGDNRNESLDSRRESVGAIHKDDLMGKVVLRLYPFHDFGLID